MSKAKQASVAFGLLCLNSLMGGGVAKRVHGGALLDLQAEEDDELIVNTSSIGHRRTRADEPTDDEAFQLAEKALHESGLTFIKLTKKIAAGTVGTIYVASVVETLADPLKADLIAKKKVLEGSADLLTQGTEVVVKDTIIGTENCKPKSCTLRRIFQACSEARNEQLYYTNLMDNFGYHDGIPRPFAFAEACDGYKPVNGRPHNFFVMEFLKEPTTFVDCLTSIGKSACRTSMDAMSAPVADVIRVWVELVDGYRYLCHGGLAQRDGWRENRVLTKDKNDVWHVKIVDFGKGMDGADECGKDLNTLLVTANDITKVHPTWLKRHKAFQKMNAVLQCQVQIPKQNPYFGGLFSGRWNCVTREKADAHDHLHVSQAEALSIYDALLAALRT